MAIDSNNHTHEHFHFNNLGHGDEDAATRPATALQSYHPKFVFAIPIMALLIFASGMISSQQRIFLRNDDKEGGKYEVQGQLMVSIFEILGDVLLEKERRVIFLITWRYSGGETDRCKIHAISYSIRSADIMHFSCTEKLCFR